MLLKLYFIFHYSKQVSATYAQQKYLHGTEQKYSYKNSKLKKKISEKIYYSKKKEKKKKARKIIRQDLLAQPGLATTPRQHHRQYLPLPDSEGRCTLSSLSIPELHPHQSHHMPLP